MPFVIPDQNKIKIKATPKKINIYVQATSATRLIEASTGKFKNFDWSSEFDKESWCGKSKSKE